MPETLRPLLLPKLVEKKKAGERAEIDRDPGADLSSSFYTQNSSSSEFSMPSTPTFSTRGHSRLPSSTSSLESSFQTFPGLVPSSPTSYDRSDTLNSAKRSLPDVEEEPQEQDEDYDMFDDTSDLYDCSTCDREEHYHVQESAIHPSYASSPEMAYDLADGFLSDCDNSLSPRVKKRRSGDSTFTGITSRLVDHFPSFSRRWRERKTSLARVRVDTLRDSAPSRACSSRSPSLTSIIGVMKADQLEMQLPSSPRLSLVEEPKSAAGPEPINIRERVVDPDEENHGLATTPLLPPLMVPESSSAAIVQSPLQSPTVAEPRESFSLVNTPIHTPTVAGASSPLLSNRPSISSFHRQHLNHLSPSSEIPPMFIADIGDEWANKLGHANYNIHPEPYLPDAFDLHACKELRSNWEQARTNYTKHLVRTGEHYGTTSNIYRLTEEKWLEVDAEWKKNNDFVVAKVSENAEDAMHLRQNTSEPCALMKIPSLNDPKGKFPKLGDEEIVGPMVQHASLLQRKPSKKAKLLKFLQDVKFPSGVMMGRSDKST